MENLHYMFVDISDYLWDVYIKYTLSAEPQPEPKEGVVREVLTNYVVFRLNCRLLLDSQHYQGRRFEFFSMDSYV